MIDDVILNAIKIDQKKENAYKNMIQHLLDKKLITQYTVSYPIQEKKSNKEIGCQMLNLEGNLPLNL